VGDVPILSCSPRCSLLHSKARHAGDHKRDRSFSEAAIVLVGGGGVVEAVTGKYSMSLLCPTRGQSKNQWSIGCLEGGAADVTCCEHDAHEARVRL